MTTQNDYRPLPATAEAETVRAPELGVATGSANFRDRFSTPSHPDGCPVLIAAALIKAESLLKEASEALESECESEQRDAWNYIRDFFEQNTKISHAPLTHEKQN